MASWHLDVSGRDFYTTKFKNRKIWVYWLLNIQEIFSYKGSTSTAYKMRYKYFHKKKNNWHHIIANWMTKNICESLLWVFWKLKTMRYDVHIRVRTFLKIMKDLYACKRRFSQIWFRLSFVSFLTALSDFYLNLKNSDYTLVQKFKDLPDLRVT